MVRDFRVLVCSRQSPTPARAWLAFPGAWGLVLVEEGRDDDVWQSHGAGASPIRARARQFYAQGCVCSRLRNQVILRFVCMPGDGPFSSSPPPKVAPSLACPVRQPYYSPLKALRSANGLSSSSSSGSSSEGGARRGASIAGFVAADGRGGGAGRGGCGGGLMLRLAIPGTGLVGEPGSFPLALSIATCRVLVLPWEGGQGGGDVLR